MARNRSELVVIYWRDIPAQVNAQVGRDRHQVLLPVRFQRAIDRAKRKAGIVTADDDIAQWRRQTQPLDGDPAAAAEAAAAAIDRAITREQLGHLAFAGGYTADITAETTVSTAELAALEELSDSDVPMEDHR
ncbi:MAG: virulence factor [Acidimicrobiales bacterium]